VLVIELDEADVALESLFMVEEMLDDEVDVRRLSVLLSVVIVFTVDDGTELVEFENDIVDVLTTELDKAEVIDGSTEVVVFEICVVEVLTKALLDVLTLELDEVDVVEGSTELVVLKSSVVEVLTTELLDADVVAGTATTLAPHTPLFVPAALAADFM